MIAALYLLICLIWGSTWLAIKIGLVGVPPFLGRVLGGDAYLERTDGGPVLDDAANHVAAERVLDSYRNPESSQMALGAVCLTIMSAMLESWSEVDWTRSNVLSTTI